MQLVEPVNLLPPSICIVCETQPDGEAVVDTLLNHRSGVPSIYNGRKYVCERCVGEFAALFGYEKGNQVQEAQFERDLARRELSNVRDNIAKFVENLDAAVNHPGVVAEGQTFEDLFTPPAVNQVREASASRLSAIESRSPDHVNKPVKKKAVERPSVPSPGLGVTEQSDNDSTVPTAALEAAKTEKAEKKAEAKKSSDVKKADAKDEDGSTRSES
jgi:hypothetical protein